MSAAPGDPEPRPGPRNAARAYLVPVVLVCVAATQLGFVELRGLTRWKGGGFGMYSDPHPDLREVWLELERASGPFRYRPQRGTAEHAASVECRTWASESCLAALARRVGRSALRSVEVFEPSVSPRDLAFERRRIAVFEPRAPGR